MQNSAVTQVAQHCGVGGGADGGGLKGKKMCLQIKVCEIKTCPSPLDRGRVPLPVLVGLPV